MSSGHGRLHREARRRRRVGRLRAIAAALVVVAAVAVAAILLTRSSATRSSASASAAAGTHAGSVASGAASAAPRVSPTGLPLGKTPLTLSGIGSPAQDPVAVTFRTPPRAGLLINLDTGQVLWQRNPYLHLHIASLTKMMTALLTVQSASANAPVLITREAVDMPGSKVGVLPAGRHVRLETLLYGLLLPSGNDAAVALAQHVAGTVNSFVKRMNEEAAKLGLGCTRYSSPSGYYDRGDYSCAADLALLAHVDLEQPRIARVARTRSAVLPLAIKGGKVYLYNNNPLLIYGYPGVTGLKTGETEAAGKCLVATAERHGVRLAVVLLHSPDPGTQARELLDAGFEDVYHQRPVPAPSMPPGE